MEVDGHPLPHRRKAGGAAHATAEVTVINGEGDARFAKVFREECMRLSRLTCHLLPYSGVVTRDRRPQ